MSERNTQPDPDIRTEPLESAERDDHSEDIDDADRPRPSTSPETEEDTASGGPAD